jgi:hypothetical protein
VWRSLLERTTVLEVGGRVAGFVTWRPDGSAAALVTTVQVLPAARRPAAGF